MKSQSSVAFVILLVTVGLLWALTSMGKNNLTTDTRNLNIKATELDGWTVGPSDAKVKIVEFADYQCPACASVEPVILNIIKKYDGKIKYTYKHFPLSQHQNARSSANAAEEAGKQGKFFEYSALLYSNQNSWATSSDPSSIYSKLGKDLGLDSEKIVNAVKNNSYDKKISDDLSQGENLGVDSTPTFYINDSKSTWANTESSWSEQLDKLLAS